MKIKDLGSSDHGCALGSKIEMNGLIVLCHLFWLAVQG